MKDNVLPDLSNLRARIDAKRLTLLFAAESGSRAWGFASPDSDFDIRFVFSSRTDAYLSLREPPQDIQYQTDAKRFDFSGWDLRKALHLAAKSNPSLLEWLGSPIVYIDEFGLREELTSIMCEWFSPRALAHHYINFMRNIRGKYMSDFLGEYTMKRYFYALRPILCIKWMEANPGLLPPVVFRDLLPVDLPRDVLAEIATILELKADTREATDHKSPTLDAFIGEWFESGHERVKKFPARQVPLEPLTNLFQRILRESDSQNR